MSRTPSAVYDAGCRACPRLAEFLDEVRNTQPSYHCAPVAPFGDACARLLIVGLAPGMHGANRTGRPFTGDYAGILLYRTLHKFGFGNQPTSISVADALQLEDCRITNAVKCLPPQNKPDTREVRNCNRFLAAELKTMKRGSAILALGTIAHRAVLLGLGEKSASHRFGHGAVHTLPNDLTLFDSYHCSRYNTQTNRLTAQMFEAVFETIARHLQRH